MSILVDVVFSSIGFLLGVSGWYLIYNTLGSPTKRNLLMLGAWLIAIALLIVVLRVGNQLALEVK